MLDIKTHREQAAHEKDKPTFNDFMVSVVRRTGSDNRHTVVGNDTVTGTIKMDGDTSSSVIIVNIKKMLTKSISYTKASFANVFYIAPFADNCADDVTAGASEFFLDVQFTLVKCVTTGF